MIWVREATFQEELLATEIEQILRLWKASTLTAFGLHLFDSSEKDRDIELYRQRKNKKDKRKKQGKKKERKENEGM